MKKDQIVNSARELFEIYGIKKVSMDEIAKKAGVTKKTVYSYFESKKELINYFIKEELNNMKTIVEEYENKNGDFYANVHQVIYKLLRYKDESKFLKHLVNDADMFDVKSLKESLKHIDGEIKKFIKQILQKAIDKGYIQVKNIDIVTFLIYKMYIALMFEWDDEYEKLNDKEIADNVLQILRSGLNVK